VIGYGTKVASAQAVSEAVRTSFFGTSEAKTRRAQKARCGGVRQDRVCRPI